MSFVPPFFSKFGKSYSDLAKKKYDYEVTAKTVNKAPQGLTIETSGLFHESSVSGKSKVTMKDKAFGETEVEVHTASGKFTTQVKANKFMDGATATLSGGYCPPSGNSKKTGFYGKLEADYAQDFFAGQATFKLSDQESPLGPSGDLSGSGVIGFQGLSAGGEAAFNLSASKLTDYNLGVQYQAGDFTSTLKTAKCADVINASWYYKANRNYQVGAQFSTNPFVGSKQITFASQYQVDVDTTAKVKADSNGVIAAAVEHRLQNPKLKVNVAAQFQAVGQGVPRATKFGLGATFGDY